jgi:hypothetical protein
VSGARSHRQAIDARLSEFCSDRVFEHAHGVKQTTEFSGDVFANTRVSIERAPQAGLAGGESAPYSPRTAAQVVLGLDARRRRGTARGRRAACIPLTLQAASRLGGGCGSSSDAPHSAQAKTIFSTSSMEQLTVLMTIGRGG